MPPPAQHSTLQSADKHLGAGAEHNIHLAASDRDIANGPAYQRFGRNHQMGAFRSGLYPSRAPELVWERRPYLSRPTGKCPLLTLTSSPFALSPSRGP